MPWASFAIMDDADLRSIYEYLMSLPPVRHYAGPIVRTNAEADTNWVTQCSTTDPSPTILPAEACPTSSPR